MKLRSWIALALLSGSWLWGMGWFLPADWAGWTVLVLASVLLLAQEAVPLPGRRAGGIAAAMFLVAAMFLPWPFRMAPLLTALGLGLLPAAGPRLRRWARGGVLAGLVLFGQSATVALYLRHTARSHDLPAPLAWLVGAVAKLLGAETTSGPEGVTIQTVRQVHSLAATWELLLDPVSLGFLVGGLILTGIVAWPHASTGTRWAAWLRTARTLAVVLAAWLPIRLGLLIGLYLHRAIRTDWSEVPTAMDQFLSPWVHLALVGPPAIAAWRLLRRPVAVADGSDLAVPALEAGGPFSGGPQSTGAAAGGPVRWVRFAGPVALVLFGAATVAVTVQWEPVGRRKAGRVVVMERHSTWEPTDRPYDTNHFGHDPSYSYTLIYNYCSHFYDMSRLVESEAITPERLGQWDVLVIKIPTARFAPDEVRAILDFVADGGGLLLIGDHTNVFRSSTYLNDICRPLGFRFRNDLLFRIGSPYEQFLRPAAVPHPAVQHVPPMHYAVSCSIDPGSSPGRAAVWDVGLWNLPPDYHAENYHPEATYEPGMRYGAFIQLWATRHGRGRVLAYTDSTIFSNFCIFQPGKAELMMGMLEWLNHTSPFDRQGLRRIAVLAGLLAGLLPLGLGLVLSRRNRIPWLVFLATVLLGGTLGSAALRHRQRSALPPPPQKPDRPMTRVVIDRTVSEVPLSLGAFTRGEGQGYGLLEQWIPRLGYFTIRRSGREAFTGDALVVIAPTRSVSEDYRRQLIEYVRRGGRLLVLDSPAVTGSTANSLLWPFGLSSDAARGKEGVLNLESGWPALEITGSSAILGGEPFFWVDQTPVGARVTFGQGVVTAIGVGSLFNDMVMGGEWTAEPDEDQLVIYDLLFAVVRGAVEGPPFEPPPRP